MKKDEGEATNAGFFAHAGPVPTINLKFKTFGLFKKAKTNAGQGFTCCPWIGRTYITVQWSML
jgi:hypothetical protein